MGILFKFLLKNIKEKKFRTFLIVFAIMMSTALFFACNSLSATFIKMYTDQARNVCGSSDIYAAAGRKAPSPFFTMNKILKYSNSFEYSCGVFNGSGTYSVNSNETISFNLFGVNLEDLQRMNPITLSSSENLKVFIGKKIIIGKNTADTYNLSLGSNIELTVKGIKEKYYIAGIAEPTGLFKPSGNFVYAVVPIDTLAALYGVPGQVSQIFMKLKKPEEMNSLIQEMSKNLKNLQVAPVVDPKDMESQISQTITIFNMMLLIVLFMSVFIIYTAFKVITMERLPVIGTLRSVGATKKSTSTILFMESIIYGVFGGAFGIFLGFGVLYVMVFIFTYDPNRPKVDISISFTAAQVIISFILGLILAFFSSIIPIIKVSKIPVKEIVLNNIEKKDKRKHYKLVAGITALAASVVLPYINGGNQQALFIDAVSMMLAFISVVLLIPYVLIIFVKLFERLYSFIFGNEGILAVKNLKDNKSILNNITLLAIGISAILMINTVSASVGREVLDAYNGFNFQIWLSGDFNKDFINKTIITPGVKDTYGVYRTWDVKIGKSSKSIMELEGISSDGKYLDFVNYNIEKSKLKELDEGRNILITDSLKKSLGVKEGDTITLSLNGKDRDYKVIGSFYSIMQDGSYAIIPERYFKLDMAVKNYATIFIKTSSDPDTVLKTIKKENQNKNLSYANTIEKMQKDNMDNNAQMMNILKAFSIISMIIGVFGILNNFIISFIERKRSIAMYRSVGMSKAQTIKMFFIEAFTGGLIGGFAGLFTGLLVISVIPKLCQAIGLPLVISYSPELFVSALISAVIITILASVMPASGTYKMKIVEAIKYE